MTEEKRRESQDRMDLSHLGMLKRMLGVLEMPAQLLQAYWDRKKLLDKIDGHLSPDSLVTMALNAGFNVETMKFEDKKPVQPIAPEFTDKIEEAESASSGEETQIEEIPATDDKQPYLPGELCSVMYEGETIPNCKINGSKEIAPGVFEYSVESEEDLIEEVPASDIKFD